MQNQAVIGANTASQFTIREYEQGDMSSVLALAQMVMSDAPAGTWEEKSWRWKHFDNPFGQSIAYVATNHEGQIVGLNLFMKWRFKVGNATVIAARSSDSITHPEYRHRGIFSALIRKEVEQSKSGGMAFTFGTPNSQSLSGFLKMGWNLVSTARPLIKVLNYPRFAAGIPVIMRGLKKDHSSRPLAIEHIAGNRLSSMSEFLDLAGPVEQLLRSHCQTRGNRLSTDRSIDYLRWRYLEIPNVKYSVLHKGNGRALSGCLIFRSSTRFNLREAVLVDTLFPQTDEGLVSPLLREMDRSLKADYVIAYVPENTFEYHILRKHGFYPTPFMGIHFIVNTLASHIPCDPKTLANWDISFSDLEVF